MQCSKRRRIRLCSSSSKAKGAFAAVWCEAGAYIIQWKVKVTRWPVDLFEKEPSRANGRSTYIHPPSLTKIRQRTSEETGNKHTNKRCSNYSMITKRSVAIAHFFVSRSLTKLGVSTSFARSPDFLITILQPSIPLNITSALSIIIFSATWSVSILAVIMYIYYWH